MLRRDSNLINAKSRAQASEENESLGSSAASRERAGTDDSRVNISAGNDASPPENPGQWQPDSIPNATSPSPLAKAPASGNSSELLETQAPEAGSGADDRHRFQSASVLSKPSPPAKRGSHKGGSTLPHGFPAKGATTKARKRSPSTDVPDIAPPHREVAWASHASRGGERTNEARSSGPAEATGGLLVDAAARGDGAGSGKSRPFERARQKCAPTSSPGSRAREPRVCRGNCAGGMQTAIRIWRLLRGTAAMGLLLAWAAFFGAQTIRRCEEWNSERALFESALRVCPDGIKTLNNLASGMLNVDEAPRAEGLLRRAIEVRSEGVRDRRSSQPTTTPIRCPVDKETRLFDSARRRGGHYHCAFSHPPLQMVPKCGRCNVGVPRLWLHAHAPEWVYNTHGADISQRALYMYERLRLVVIHLRKVVQYINT